MALKLLTWNFTKELWSFFYNYFVKLFPQCLITMSKPMDSKYSNIKGLHYTTVLNAELQYLLGICSLEKICHCDTHTGLFVFVRI